MSAKCISHLAASLATPLMVCGSHYCSLTLARLHAARRTLLYWLAQVRNGGAHSGAWPAGGAGALVACEASHMCMVARGVEKHASSTITTAARGAYLQHTALRSETLQHLMQHEGESESC